MDHSKLTQKHAPLACARTQSTPGLTLGNLALLKWPANCAFVPASGANIEPMLFITEYRPDGDPDPPRLLVYYPLSDLLQEVQLAVGGVNISTTYPMQGA